MFLIRALCLNATGKGVSCGGTLRPLLATWNVVILALSEADIPAISRAKMALEWRCYGWFAAFSQPEDGTCRVALFSRFPMKQVNLCTADCQHRHVAALLGVQSNQDTMPLLVSAIYLQSGAFYMAQAQALDLISAADSTGRRCLLLGDWNLEQNEGDLAMLIQQGVVRACDAAARGQQLPMTGPVYRGSRRRRIDFALTLGDLFATAVDRMPEVEVGSLSDHRAVSYDFDFVALLVGPLPGRTLWLKMLLSFDLERGHLDEAWALLSDTAKDLLCVSDAADRAVPRSSEWRPAANSARNDRARTYLLASVPCVDSLPSSTCV